MANDSTTVLPPIPWWLVGAAVVLFAVALPKPLAIDEESYLWLGRNVAFDNPYGWTRAWPGGEGFMYAHPPLHLWFMRLVSPLTSLPWIRLSALPWVVLWAASSALWIRRTCHHPHVAAIAWLGSTTVVLGLQDSVMIDLPYVALGTAALAAYREGLTDRRVGWMLAAGLAFGLAVETKYPAAALGFVFALHSWHYGAALAFWAPAAAIIGGTEAWLYTVHGRWHPAVVWETRALIPRGDLAGRVLGTFARGALLPATPALLLTRPVHAAVGLGLAVGALAWARPAGLSAGNVVFLLVCAALGAMALSRAAAGLFASPLRRRKGDRGDGLLLGGAVVTTFVGVMVFHNFASGSITERYSDTLNDPNSVYTRTLSSKKEVASFLGQAGLTGRLFLRENVRLFGSYEALYLSGLALAPDQMRGISTSVTPAASLDLRTQGSVFIHGGRIGVEILWP